MITQGVLSVVLGLVSGLVSLLPQFSVTLDSAAAAAQTTGSTVGMLNGYFPVATVGGCLVAVFGFKVFMAAYRVVFFVYHQFWGSD